MEECKDVLVMSALDKRDYRSFGAERQDLTKRRRQTTLGKLLGCGTILATAEEYETFSGVRFSNVKISFYIGLVKQLFRGFN